MTRRAGAPNRGGVAPGVVPLVLSCLVVDITMAVLLRRHYAKTTNCGTFHEHALAGASLAIFGTGLACVAVFLAMQRPRKVTRVFSSLLALLLTPLFFYVLLDEPCLGG